MINPSGYDCLLGFKTSNVTVFMVREVLRE